MSLHPLRSRAGAIVLAVAVMGPLAQGHGRALWSVEHDDQVMVFPDTEDHVTISADLHTHTVFSDGHVWPNVRVSSTT